MREEGKGHLEKIHLKQGRSAYKTMLSEKGKGHVIGTMITTV